MIQRILFVCFAVVGLGTSVQAFQWYASFEAGNSVPTESFDSLADDDFVYGLSIDYIPSNHLGVRVAYLHQEFQYDNREIKSHIQMESLGVWAVMDYPFPKYFRLFAIIGPTYFSSQDGGGLMTWNQSDDIGWSGGAGLDFHPFPGWGFRFHSLYNSALFGDQSPRVSWVNSTIGMSFKF